jgi:hypothetical protein
MPYGCACFACCACCACCTCGYTGRDGGASLPRVLLLSGRRLAAHQRGQDQQEGRAAAAAALSCCPHVCPCYLLPTRRAQPPRCITAAAWAWARYAPQTAGEARAPFPVERLLQLSSDFGAVAWPRGCPRGPPLSQLPCGHASSGTAEKCMAPARRVFIAPLAWPRKALPHSFHSKRPALVRLPLPRARQCHAARCRRKWGRRAPLRAISPRFRRSKQLCQGAVLPGARCGAVVDQERAPRIKGTSWV